MKNKRQAHSRPTITIPASPALTADQALFDRAIRDTIVLPDRSKRRLTRGRRHPRKASAS